MIQTRGTRRTIAIQSIKCLSNSFHLRAIQQLFFLGTSPFLAIARGSGPIPSVPPLVEKMIYLRAKSTFYFTSFLFTAISGLATVVLGSLLLLRKDPFVEPEAPGPLPSYAVQAASSNTFAGCLAILSGATGVSAPLFEFRAGKEKIRFACSISSLCAGVMLLIASAFLAYSEAGQIVETRMYADSSAGIGLLIFMLGGTVAYVVAGDLREKLGLHALE